MKFTALYFITIVWLLLFLFYVVFNISRFAWSNTFAQYYAMQHGKRREMQKKRKEIHFIKISFEVNLKM
jgi:hypothetical protein